MIFGVATIHLDTKVKQGDKLRVVGEVKVHYREDESKDTTLIDEAECIVHQQKGEARHVGREEFKNQRIFA